MPLGARTIAFAWAISMLAGCATSDPDPQDSSGDVAISPPASSPIACGGFTMVTGVVGMSRYEGVLDWEDIHRDLEAAGFDMHPEPTAVAGRDLAGDPFGMSSSGAYEVRYSWNASEPWPSEAASARANASWNASEERFNDSVRAFEAATGLRSAERGWRPDLISGTTPCP